ncbi:PAS domain S-box-containing protein [Salinimicrobium catena]|uniref:histidine kinase n=1 Tax=Salinimicrobium catena TaxID=390640 RepID=A0A1H5N4B3_9FLAO|nr:PAS domain-containing protein [Salinimicrobium catena]SDL34635.1 PAS domain S-box-containing protein [Salinimicrobium catena]SEE95488.1 PAS domain S-box-containing protein [Salinimicrobium catena]
MTDFYLEMFSSLPLPAVLLEPVEGGLRIRDVNKKYFEVTGKKEGELIGKKVREVFPQTTPQEIEVLGKLENSVEKVRSSAKPDKVSCFRLDLVNHETGETEEKYWEAENTPIFSKDETVKYILHTATDQTAEIFKERARKQIATELEQKEKELWKRKKRYQALVQEAFDLVGILDIEGNYKFVSESSISILGIPPQDFNEQNAFDFIHPEDKGRVFEEFSQIKEKKKLRIAPFRYRDADGVWRWFETNVTNMVDDPNVEGVVINSREVTDLIQKNCELQQLHERYELAAAATGDLIYDWDLVTDSVKRFFTGKEKQFGYQRDEIDQRRFWKEHVHPEELEDLRKILKSALADTNRSQIRTTYRIKRADGSYAHLIDRGMILRDEAGKAVRLIGATSDISGLVNRRNALRLANKRFTYAMKATKEMIWDWDITKGYIDRGKAFKKMFGIEVHEKSSVENFWFERIVEKDRYRIKDSLYKTLEDPSLDKWREEYKIWKPNGQNAYVIDRGYIIRDPEGKAVRMVGATLDVTESRQMLKKIKKQNKLLKEVAWEQAHIVRAPIARLKGLLNLFDEDYNGEWEKEEILQLIKDSAEELDRIVTGIIRKTEGIKIEK